MMKSEKGVEKASNLGGLNHDMPKRQRARWRFSAVGIGMLFLVFLLCSLSWAEEGKLTENNLSGQTDLFIDKIEPVLEQESITEAELNIIVYVESPDLSTSSEAVKARYSEELSGYSEQIRALHRRYRPQVSFNPDEERAFFSAPEGEMNAVDRGQLEVLRETHDAYLDEMKKEVGLALEEAVQPNQDTVADFIASQGGVVTSRSAVISAMGATIPSEALLALANHPLVLSVMKDSPATLELNVSVPTVDYSAWWGGTPPLNGGAYDFGLVDTGVQENHPALSGATFYTNSGSSTDAGGHGTHVTGIVASADTLYRGGAYGLDAIIWSALPATQSAVFSHMEWQAASAGQNPEVINHSLGYGTASGTDYSLNDAFYDAFIANYNIMVSKSAGNGGWSDADRTITHPAPSYNLLAVANMDDQNTASRTDDVRRTSSSVGPTLGDRKKPDITAPGSNIMSCNNSWNDMGAPDFVSMSGTSMAAPHVAAAIILLEDGGNHDPMAQKAVLINTADAWDSNNTSTTVDDGPVNGSHWDKSYGWGYLDMGEAYFNRTDYFVDSVVPRNDNATPDDYKLYKGALFGYEKATLVWEKRAGYLPGVTPTTRYDLSDLNLRLYNEANDALIDSEFDDNDNVHQVSRPSGLVMDAVIKVYAWSTSFDGVSAEPYALATEENFTAAAPPGFVVSLSMPASAGTSSQITVTADVANSGEVAAHANSVTLTLPAGFSIASGSNPQDIGIIEEGASGLATWVVNTPVTTGAYTLSASNTSTCYEEIYTGASMATPITISGCAHATDFSASQTSGCAPLAVNFTDLTTNSPTNWVWSFGDGGTSTLQNPSHTYTSAGTYTVTLTASGACGSDQEIKIGYVTVNQGPTAEFIASATSGPAPLAVNFTDQSTNSPTSWLWSFGDGGTSTLQNPSRTYSSPGTYTVTLTATNACGSDVETKTGYIVVGGAAVPDITVTDAVAPIGDLQVPFGSITVGFNSDQTVTIVNDGSAALIVGNIAQANPLASPFSILNDTCSGSSLAPSANCSLTVSFAPTAAGASSDTFDIPSNDPDENPVTMSVSGTGVDAGGGGGGGGGCFIDTLTIH